MKQIQVATAQDGKGEIRVGNVEVRSNNTTKISSERLFGDTHTKISGDGWEGGKIPSLLKAIKRLYLGTPMYETSTSNLWLSLGNGLVGGGGSVCIYFAGTKPRYTLLIL